MSGFDSDNDFSDQESSEHYVSGRIDSIYLDIRPYE